VSSDNVNGNAIFPRKICPPIIERLKAGRFKR